MFIIDDRSAGALQASSGNAWRLITDGVMGGVSQGRLESEVFEGRACLHISGEVRLENNGGFIQMGLDLSPEVRHHMADFAGLALEVMGNGEQYNIHLRTTQIQHPWQSYRASFRATPAWSTPRLPFQDFVPHRIDAPLVVSQIERIGIVAIGRAFRADLRLAKLGLYR